MTREEAIERIKQNKAAAEFYAGMAQNTNTIENELKDIEALDMAIQALTDRPTGHIVTKSSGKFNPTVWAECSECGKPIDAWDKFCRHCGAKVGGGDK